MNILIDELENKEERKKNKSFCQKKMQNFSDIALSEYNKGEKQMHFKGERHFNYPLIFILFIFFKKSNSNLERERGLGERDAKTSRSWSDLRKMLGYWLFKFVADCQKKGASHTGIC